MLNEINIRQLSAPNEKRWLNWRKETRDGKVTKVPYTTTGQRASSTDPATWGTLDEVLAAQKRFDGIGIVFDGTQLGIDLDHCINRGLLSITIDSFVERAHTYTEISPSQTGLHFYFNLTEPLELERNRHGSIECYTADRYFTVTGRPWCVSYDIRTITPEEALKILGLLGYPWKKEIITAPTDLPQAGVLAVDDKELLTLMFASRNGVKIHTLYEGDTTEYGGDDSSADAALCAHLAFWTKKDTAQIERLWLASPLGARSKTQERTDYRQRTIAFAIENCAEVYRAREPEDRESVTDTKSDDDSSHASQATQIAELVMNNPALTLFLDQYKVAHVRMPVGDHFEIWPVGSSDFRYWLSNEYFTREGKAVGTNTLSAALNTIEGKARSTGLSHKLHNRIAGVDGALWYDLGDERHRAVHIDAQGWSVVDNPPILFRRLPYHEAQVEPVFGGDIRELLRFVNVKEQDQQLLLLVYLISAFIPGFPHPLLYVHGQQGSAKTSLLETLHALIDPSALGSLSLPRNIEDLKQTLHHHSAFACFDNVSGIDWETADLLCRAVTGAGFSKRKLYTDDETVIYRVQANVAINGVNLGSSRPDLLERSILMELTRIEEGERKQHAELHKAFAEAQPRILGAIFDAVSRALVVLPSIKLTGMFRMADFTKYGAAIAEVIGYPQEDFLDAYRRNITAQNEVVLDGHVVGELIFALMESTDRWEGTPTRLLSEIKRLAVERFIDDRQLPKNANSLTRQMRDIKPALEAAKIGWFRDIGHERTVVIRKLPGGDSTPGSGF